MKKIRELELALRLDESRFSTCDWIETSSEETGSSATRKRGAAGRSARRDTDALSLSTGELVGVAAVAVTRQADALERVAHVLAAVVAVSDPWISSPARTISLIFWCRVQRPTGSGRRSAACHRLGDRARLRHAENVAAVERIDPAVGSISRSSTRRASRFPRRTRRRARAFLRGRIASSTPSTAFTSPSRRWEHACADRESRAHALRLEQQVGHRAPTSRFFFGEALKQRANLFRTASTPTSAAPASNSGGCSPPVERVVAATSRKRQPLGQAQRTRHHASNDLQRLRLRHSELRDRVERALGIGGAAAARKPSRTGPYSTTRPAYITAATSSQISATTPRSCVISRIAIPPARAARQQLEDLRLDRHVERRRRLVGDQEARLARRAPSRSSRAGACRPTARADTREAAAPTSAMPTS